MRASPARLVEAALLSAALLLSACNRSSEPSAHYAIASDIHGKLYVRMMDEAYLDPRMAEVKAELRLVEPASISHQNAQALLEQIAKGRATALAAREERVKSEAEAERLRLAAAAATAAMIPAPIAPPPPPAVSKPTSTPDAGLPAPPGPPDPYGPGASIAALNQATGGCLLPDAPFTEGERVSGMTYLLADVYACKEKLPGFVGQVALVVDGRIYRRVSAAQLKRVTVPAAAGAQAAEAPAAGTPAPPPESAASAPLAPPTAPAGPPPESADAGNGPAPM